MKSPISIITFVTLTVLTCTFNTVLCNTRCLLSVSVTFLLLIIVSYFHVMNAGFKSD